MIELVLAAWLLTSPQADEADLARELPRIVQRLAAAWTAGQCEAWAAFVAPEWSVIHITGAVMTRAQALELCKAPPAPIGTMTSDDFWVRAFGDAAVVTGRTVATTTGPRPESVTLRFTDVFVRRNGRWQVVASQATRLPGERPNVDPKIYVEPRQTDTRYSIRVIRPPACK